jgi:hypothetical protein
VSANDAAKGEGVVMNDVRKAAAVGPTVERPAPDFQQAKSAPMEPVFLPIVAAPPQLAAVADKPERAPKAKPKAKAKPEPKLTRVAFTVSRLTEFCSEKELTAQVGHSVWDWLRVVAKELVDNALDACEEAEIAPTIAVTVEPDTIIVEDNAGGIDADTITSVLDYTVRVSSREAYVSPTRGAQGNALKTILAMGYALSKYADGVATAGVTVIESRSVRHRIEFKVDHINNQPKVVRRTSASPVTVGTKITVKWPHTRAALFSYAATQFKELVAAYAWLNPHLTLRGTWLAQEFVNVRATNPQWEKWRPNNPTSPHWYDPPRLQRYLAAHVARDRDLGQRRAVRDFIAEFRGLSGTAVRRKVLAEVGCSHQSLASFFGVERVNSVGVTKLLAAMQKHSKPVKPQLLGIIGEEHLKARFLEAGGNADTFRYHCRMGTNNDGIPYVWEGAFGLHRAGLEPGGGGARVVNNNGVITVVGGRLIVTGANWSAAIGNPFRSFGSTGEGLESTLAKVRANADQPVICCFHLASARLLYADRGKSSIIITDDARQPDDD